MPVRAKPQTGALRRTPPPPDGLSEHAAVVWTHCARLLIQKGALTAGDLPALEAYARAASRARALEIEIERTGYVVEGRANSLMGACNAAHACAVRWSIALGLACNSRASFPRHGESFLADDAPAEGIASVLPLRRRRATP